MRVPPRCCPARRAAACTAILLATLTLAVISGGTPATAQAPAPATPAATTPAPPAAAAPKPAAVPAAPAAAAPAPAPATPPATPAAATTPAAGQAPAAPAAPATPPLRDKPRALPPFQQLPVITEDQEKAFRAQQSAIQKFLRAGTIPAGQEQFFTQFYYGYALARWTYVDRQHEVAGYRRQLRNELIMSYKPGRTNQAHEQLTALVLNFMKNVVRKDLNFSPAARYNAILMIGDLNQAEAAVGGQNPVPLPEALPLLVAAAQDPDQIDAVIMGALIGLRRHISLGIADAQMLNGQVIPTLIALAKMQKPDRVRSDEGHAWLRTLAVEALADWGGAGNPAALAEIFRNIVDETDSPIFLRYAAADGLGRLKYQGGAAVDINAFVHTLGMLAVSVCDSERKRLNDEQKTANRPGSPFGYGSGYESSYGSGSGSMSGSMPGAEYGGAEMPSPMGAESAYGYGMGMAAPVSTEETRRIERLRRRFEEGLSAVLSGLGKKTKAPRRNEAAYGLDAVSSQQAQKELIASLSTPIHDCFAVIDEKKDGKQIDAADLATAIEDARTKLASVVALVGAAPPPAVKYEPIPKGPAMMGMSGMPSGMPGSMP